MTNFLFTSAPVYVITILAVLTAIGTMRLSAAFLEGAVLKYRSLITVALAVVFFGTLMIPGFDTWLLTIIGLTTVTLSFMVSSETYLKLTLKLAENFRMTVLTNLAMMALFTVNIWGVYATQGETLWAMIVFVAIAAVNLTVATAVKHKYAH